MASKVAAATRKKSFRRVFLQRGRKQLVTLVDLKAALSGEGKSGDVGDER